MLYDLSNGFDLEKFKNRTIDLINQRAVVDLTKKHPTRSLPQNAYLHLILGFFACEYGCSLDYVKREFYKKVCNKPIFERKKTAKNGEIIIELRSSRDLDKEEMTLSIERFRNWSAAEGIYLPDANEHHLMDYMRREINRNKEFI